MAGEYTLRVNSPQKKCVPVGEGVQSSPIRDTFYTPDTGKPVTQGLADSYA